MRAESKRTFVADTKGNIEVKIDVKGGKKGASKAKNLSGSIANAVTEFKNKKQKLVDSAERSVEAARKLVNTAGARFEGTVNKVEKKVAENPMEAVLVTAALAVAPGLTVAFLAGNEIANRIDPETVDKVNGKIDQGISAAKEAANSIRDGLKSLLRK